MFHIIGHPSLKYTISPQNYDSSQRTRSILLWVMYWYDPFLNRVLLHRTRPTLWANTRPICVRTWPIHVTSKETFYIIGNYQFPYVHECYNKGHFPYYESRTQPINLQIWPNPFVLYQRIFSIFCVSTRPDSVRKWPYTSLLQKRTPI